MARAKKTYPEEAKLAAQMKALREKTGGDYTDAQEKQMSGWRSELNDLQFRRLATARVNKIGRMLLLLGNLGKKKPSVAMVDEIEKVFQSLLTEVFTSLRGKSAAKTEGFIKL